MASGGKNRSPGSQPGAGEIQEQFRNLVIGIDSMTLPRPTNKELGPIHGVEAKRVTRIVDECLEQEWIRPIINKFPRRYEPSVSAELSAKLSEHLRVNACVVSLDREPMVQIPKSSTHETQRAQRAAQAVHSDWVHFLLGQETGKLLPPWISNDCRIGLSSGRGVRYSINALPSIPIEKTNVTLMSLTGALEMRAHSLHSVLMDGDPNVAALATHFSSDVRVRMAACSITDVNASPWFMDRSIPGPSKALVGIGVLQAGNRFCARSLAPSARAVSGVEARGRRPMPLETVGALLDELESCVNACKDAKMACLVAEVANYFYFIEPLSVPSTMRANVERIGQLIEQVNERLRRVTIDHFRSVEEAWVVAGTSEKAPAIYALLRHGFLNVAHLVTDSFAASLLMSFPPLRRRASQYATLDPK